MLWRAGLDLADFDTPQAFGISQRMVAAVLAED